MTDFSAPTRAAARCRGGNGRRFTARRMIEKNLYGTGRSTVGKKWSTGRARHPFGGCRQTVATVTGGSPSPDFNPTCPTHKYNLELASSPYVYSAYKGTNSLAAGKSKPGSSPIAAVQAGSSTRRPRVDSTKARAAYPIVDDEATTRTTSKETSSLPKLLSVVLQITSERLKSVNSMDQLEPGSLIPPKSPAIEGADCRLKVKLKIIQVHGLPHPILNFGSAYVVAVTAGEGVEEKTRPVKGATPHWNQEITMKKRSGGGFKRVGTCELDCGFVQGLSPKDSRSVKCPLTPESNSKSTNMELEVIISAIANDTVTENPTDLSSVAAAVHRAIDPIVEKKSPTQLSAVQGNRDELGAVADAATGLSKTFSPLNEIFGKILKDLEIFCGVVDTVTEIHPYVRVAWNLIKWIPKSLLSELDLQDNITELCKELCDTLSFIEDADPIKTWKDPALKNQQTILSRLVLQILECCRFLTEFFEETREDNFVLRTVKHTFSREDATKKIKEYLTTLKSLQDAFEGRASVNTQVAVFRFLATVDTIVHDLRELQKFQILLQLQRPGDATFRPDKGCLPGTRVQILEHLIEWIETPNSDTRAFILLGIAGSGIVLGGFGSGIGSNLNRT
ncbi:hypothetical protein B0H19DRAFT_1086229 [Mycena capillaripes]|nr:hypothetical protein B0H19DRAFT_1086229 [Mycena capillaripes]